MKLSNIVLLLAVALSVTACLPYKPDNHIVPTYPVNVYVNLTIEENSVNTTASHTYVESVEPHAPTVVPPLPVPEPRIIYKPTKLCAPTKELLQLQPFTVEGYHSLDKQSDLLSALLQRVKIIDKFILRSNTEC